MEDSFSDSVLDSESVKEITNIEDIINLTRNCEFFKKLIEEQQSDEIHKLCCEVMEIKDYNPGELIIRYGDIGCDFYIILKGTVGIYVPTLRRSTIMIKDVEILDKTYKRAKKLSIFRYTGTSITDYNDKNTIYLTPVADTSNLERVLIMGPGESFGELALLNNRPRAATVISVSNSTLAKLSKISFEKLLGKFTEKRLNEKLRFFQIHPMFFKCSKANLMKISFYFIWKKISRGHYLFKIGDPVDGVYFVKNGEFLV